MKPSNGGKYDFNTGINNKPSLCGQLVDDSDHCRFRSFLDKRVLIFLAVLFHVSVTFPQRQAASFAWYSEVQVQTRPVYLMLADLNADTVNEVVALSRNPSSLTVFQVQAGGAFISHQEITFSDSCDVGATGFLNADPYADIVVYFRMAHVVRFYFGQSDGTLREGGQFYIDGLYDNIDIADITQDGRPDIILYGKKSPGIMVLPGNGDGTFRLPQRILEDIPVGKAVVKSLNGDGIPDLVILDWVTNTINIYYGDGIGQYSEETSFQLSDEIDDLAVVDLDGNSTYDLVVVSSKSKTLHIYFGTGTGEFLKAQIIRLAFSPTSLSVADLNGDRRPDILTVDKQNGYAGVFINQGRGFFGEGTVFAIGNQPLSYVLGSLTRDRYPDLVLCERRSQKLSVYWNEKKSEVRGREYAVGRLPKGITVGDFNQDGIPDVAVANEASSTLSILFGRREKCLRGQVSIAAVMPPQYLLYAGTQNGHASFLTSANSTEQISVVDVDLHGMTANICQIPTEGTPSVAHAWLTRSGSVDFLSVNYSGTVPLSVSYVEQVGETRFSEKNFKPASPSTMLGVAVADINNDNHFDLVYVAKDKRLSRPYLVASFSDSLLELHDRRVSFYFPDTSYISAIITPGDLNNDGIIDLVLNIVTKNSTKMYVALGRGDSTFVLTDQSFPRVMVSHPQNIKLRDADGDGVPDILLINEISKDLVLYRGKKDGTFFPPRTIADGEDIGDFEIADLFRTGIPQLLITDQKRNTLKILTIE